MTLKQIHENAKIYREIKGEQPALNECFFAFSNEQFEKGKKEIGVTDNAVLLSGPGGMIGTRKGLDEFHNFCRRQEKRVQESCHPLGVFCYEYSNHEGDYSTGGEAWDITLEYFSDFDFNTATNQKAVNAIRQEWRKINF